MNKSIQVLSVPHQLQGEGFLGHVKDTSYESLIEDRIAQVDFVFEEASGRRPSIAELLTRKMIGENHYLDVDPAPDEREQHGIAKATSMSFPIDPAHSRDSFNCQLVEEHRKREEIWLKRILDQDFTRGLMVCGSAHGLSFAFRLKLAGFADVALYEYLPYRKICGHITESNCEHK